jgi:hypothetical protein
LDKIERKKNGKTDTYIYVKKEKIRKTKILGGKRYRAYKID